jgi:hypothetical protein
MNELVLNAVYYPREGGGNKGTSRRYGDNTISTNKYLNESIIKHIK